MSENKRAPRKPVTGEPAASSRSDQTSTGPAAASTDPAAQADRAAQTDRADRAGQAGQADRAGRADRADRGGQADRGGAALAGVKFLTVAEVATVMRVSKMTVYRMVHGGELPAVRVGRSFRVPEQAVHDYLRSAYIEAG